jgi:hypothetical protein
MNARRIISTLIFFALLVVSVYTRAGKIDLEWDHSPDPLVVGYRIYAGTNSGMYTQSQTVPRTNWTTFSNLTYAVRYYFVATAFNAAGVESIPSNEVAATIGQPRTPSNLALTNAPPKPGT